MVFLALLFARSPCDVVFNDNMTYVSCQRSAREHVIQCCITLHVAPNTTHWALQHCDDGMPGHLEALLALPEIASPFRPDSKTVCMVHIDMSIYVLKSPHCDTNGQAGAKVRGIQLMHLMTPNSSAAAVARST